MVVNGHLIYGVTGENCYATYGDHALSLSLIVSKISSNHVKVGVACED